MFFLRRLTVFSALTAVVITVCAEDGSAWAAGPADPAPVALTSMPALAAEAQAWEQIATIDDTAQLERFIRTYPTGAYAAEARRRLADLYGQSAASFQRGTAREDDVTRSANAPFGAVAIPSAAAADGYASITWDEKTVGAAASTALRACKVRHGSCRIAMLYRRNQCAAVAVGGGVLGWARALSTSEAEAAAIAMCAEKGGSACAVKETQCNAGSTS